ncbi:hypothetical protein ACQR1W_13525 [Bradyrhizobium sp. HKCCYLS1011]|uniref:hypothetical protein n=1 Tax=Bradyrhizobium sp. HKCCYLS1011 TaxID=3420733 RepID=UPI003EB9B030
MNTPLKFDQDKRPDFQFERSDHRAHYDDLTAQALASIARHKGLIISMVAFVLALACFIIPILPRKYSAEGLIYPNLFSREQGKRDQEKLVALASVDAAAIVTGEARLIRSDAFLRAVAKRLGPEATKSPSWTTQNLDWVRATLLPETRNHSPFDRRVAMLRNKVAVMNDTRSYLISISFTATSPDEAARVVNAFLVQYLRDKAIQRGLDRVAGADAELQQQLAVYGDKHPKALHAAAELDAARAALETMLKPQEGDQSEIAGDQSVRLAVPNQTPTSPNGFAILGLSFFSALLAGIALAIRLDRREARRTTVVYQTQPQ